MPTTARIPNIMQNEQRTGPGAAARKPHAVVVLPGVGGGRLVNAGLRRWLSRSPVRLASVLHEPLARIVEVLGLAYPQRGRAALRLWGHTGNRPATWIAGADPVYLEPRLNHVHLHALIDSDVTRAELRRLFDHLQATLADDAGLGFVRIGCYGYVTSNSPLATAAASAAEVHGQMPNEFMPSGDEAASYRNLRSEIEMALHDHDVNQQRMVNGQPPINSLWLWGGGVAPEQGRVSCPPLFANDPLVRGFWHRVSGRVESWTGTIGACLEASDAGFVAMAPAADTDPRALERCLVEIREALANGRLDRVTLLFADGLCADVRHSDRLRFWRREHAYFGAPA
jgi:hypothetical protein